jgi:uncharacterized metal-binding protein YceD (DUF177 family)
LGAQFLRRQRRGKKIKNHLCRIISHIQEKIIRTPDSLLVDAQKTAALLLSSLRCRACVCVRVSTWTTAFFFSKKREDLVYDEKRGEEEEG